MGIYYHLFWLLLLGYGVLGGIGLGLGYISPVSTLIKWFPDKPGMATGLAIMGFGGGAMIAAPLSVKLMDIFHGMHHGLGVTGHLPHARRDLLHLHDVRRVHRAHPRGRLVAGGIRSGAHASKSSCPRYNVSVNNAWKTPQFWLLWIMLLVNVTAGIGVLSQASPMSQDFFPGRVTAVIAGGFVGLLSIANMSGRFLWSSLSDRDRAQGDVSRVLHARRRCSTSRSPRRGRAQSVALFVVCCFLILTMYGGGFATIPAYLRDLFGTRQVGAIHGRLLTAWSTAGVLGPALVSYIGQYQTSHGVPKAHQYDLTMYIMAGLLVIGAICDLMVKPVDARYPRCGQSRHGDYAHATSNAGAQPWLTTCDFRAAGSSSSLCRREQLEGARDSRVDVRAGSARVGVHADADQGGGIVYVKAGSARIVRNSGRLT